MFLLAPARGGETVLPVWADTSRSREERVLSCAKCHQDTYANWKKGPHAQASFRLTDYREEVWKNPAFPIAEKEGIKTTACLDCHEPHNMFENKVPVDWDGKKFDVIGKVFARKEGPSTGIDCLSCHAKGQSVITRQDYKRSAETFASPDFCNPKPSTMFSSDNYCLVCHALVRHQASAYAEKHKNTGLKTCTQCHMETNAKGTPTHYYFWARDKAEDYKRRPKSLIPFDKVRLSIKKSHRDRVLTIQWINDFSPHDVIPSGPRQNVFKLEVIDENQSVQFTKYIRFFGKEFLHEVPKSEIAINVHLPFDGAYIDKFPLPKNLASVGKIRLTVYRKASYYLDDSYSEKFYEREVPYRL